MSAEPIDLIILVKDTIVSISLDNTDKVGKIYDLVYQKVPRDIQLLLESVEEGACDICKLETPVLSGPRVRVRVANKAIIKKCRDQAAEPMNWGRTINYYFNTYPEVTHVSVLMELPDRIYRNIKFHVLVHDALVAIDMNNKHVVKDIYEIVFKATPQRIQSLLGHIRVGDCRLHKLKQPILIQQVDNVVSKLSIGQCLAEANLEPMVLNREVYDYFSSDPEHVDRAHVVMQLPDVIRLNVLVQNALVTMDISNERSVRDLHEVLSNQAPPEVRKLLKHITKESCGFYKFEQPILPEYDNDIGLASEATVNQCKVALKQRIQADETIKKLFLSNPEDQKRIHVLMELPQKVHRKIELNVLVQNSLAIVDIDNARSVKDIYEEAQKSLPEEVASKLQASTLTYAKLSPPIKYTWNRNDVPVDDATVRRCQEAPNEIMKPVVKIANHFGRDVLPDSAIHVMIMAPEDAIKNAINNMKRVDSKLYRLLQVRRTNPKAWCKDDYKLMEDPVSAHETFQGKLEKPREYNLESGNRFFKLALSVLGKDMFGKCLFKNAEDLPNNFMPDEPATVSDGPATVSAEELELLIFSTLEPAFVKRIERFKGKNASSHFKQALFFWHFVLHPALAIEEQGQLKLTTESDSQIKYYVMRSKDDGGWRTAGSYRPRSDMAIISQTHGCPFLLCEVDSNQIKKDKHRMLAVATSAAQIGQYFLEDKTRLFVLMAIFVTEDLIVERYLVSQATVDDSNVVITQRNFNLGKPEDAYEFLKQMYNFAHHVNEMARKLDDTKKGLLQQINEAGKNIRSYESNKKSENRDTGNTHSNRPLPSISENQNEANDAPEETWKRSDVCQLLTDIGCNTGDIFDIDGHPGVICIPKTDEDLVYMKYISHRDVRELEILQYLNKYDPSWTYILPFEHWDIKGGTLVKFLDGGVHVTDYLQPGSNPTPIALQLVEAVGFLHRHNVAHRDIKSENILVDSSGKLWIIDYSLACQVNGEDEMRKGFVGTPGRVAPEVEKEDEAYSPLRADRWAVGYMIKTISKICGPSPQRKFLEQLSSLLMADDPSLRLRMQTCSKLIKSQQDVSKQTGNVKAPSKFMDGGNNQRLAVAS